MGNIKKKILIGEKLQEKKCGNLTILINNRKKSFHTLASFVFYSIIISKRGAL